MRTLLLSLLLIGCSSSSNNNTDAGTTPGSDAGAGSDSGTTAAPDVMKYCMDVTTHCTGANAQYPEGANALNQCLGTAATFAVGTSADQTGNTLGCRAYHAGAPSMSDPATHCIHAGPAGDQIGNAGTCGDACTSFCNLETKVCGTTTNALTGITAQYQDLAACMTACAGFAKNKYALGGTPAAPTGDSLACRLYHATNAALYTKLSMTNLVNVHCGHTGPAPSGTGNPCLAGQAPAP